MSISYDVNMVNTSNIHAAPLHIGRIYVYVLYKWIDSKKLVFLNNQIFIVIQHNQGLYLILNKSNKVRNQIIWVNSGHRLI